jgi:pseudomonalisin
MSRMWAVVLHCTSSRFLTILLILSIVFAAAVSIQAQPAATPDPRYVQPTDRITAFVDDEQRVALVGNRHPMAVSRYDGGAVTANFSMQHMVLTLLPDASQQQALTQLVESQHDPESASYHQWLTPEQYAERFGVSDSDIAQIVSWLQSHGFIIEEIPAGRRSIIFSGNAGQVQEAFHTAIHTFKVGSEIHHANVQDPQIPAAFAQVVGGVVSLHDFHSSHMHKFVRKVSPQLTSGSSHYLAPADFATIYDLNPLYQSSINGGGQTIAIVGRTNIKASDVTAFRSSFGLPANNPQIIVNGTNPGDLGGDEETEADLDVEWSGAVAKNATIKFVVSQSTSTTDGVDLSAQYIVNNNLAPVMSTSFGLCEAWLGSSGNSFINNLWQQAAAEGITVFVSSGDNGAAGCDSASSAKSTYGRAVNGLCSSPYSVCVGGNEFADTTNPSLYWASSNSAAQGSALSYIPEVVWNESGSSGLWSSGGGASTIYGKPAWQSGVGVPADAKRDVPDVALTAAGHDGYLIVQEGGTYVVGGTSAASPSFAGIMALVVENLGTRQGDINTVLYPLATRQRSGGAAVFHDITIGNNSVPGLTGFNASVGYDQATGLGSVDGSVLVNHWNDATIVPTFHPAAAAGSISVGIGKSNTVVVSVTVSGGFNAAVSFSISGLPTGVTGSFSPVTLAAPGSGSTTLTLASSSTLPGTYSANIVAASGSNKQVVSLSITVPLAPTFTIRTAGPSVSIAPGKTGSISITTTPNSTFNSAIALSVTGLPTGISVQFLPSSIVGAPGAGSPAATFSVASSVVPKTYSVTLIAMGGGVTQKQPLTIYVPSVSSNINATRVTIMASAKGSIELTTVALAGLDYPAVPLALSHAAVEATGLKHIGAIANDTSVTQSPTITPP